MMTNTTTASTHTKHTTEHVRADVGRTTTLVTQQVAISDEMFAKTEVSDSHSASACV